MKCRIICLSDLKELVTYISKNKQPDFKFDDISPELDMMISQKASQVVKEAPQMEAIKSITNLGQQQQQNPLQFAQQLAQLEVMICLK